MMKIKANDTVVVLSGKDKGKKGKVLKAMPKENKVIVEGVSIAACHTKPRKAIRAASSAGRSPSAPIRSSSSARSAIRASASAISSTATRRSASARSAAPKSEREERHKWLDCKLSTRMRLLPL